MLNMKAKGFDVLLSVHDEGRYAEQDLTFMSVHDYESLMAESPEWARGAYAKSRVLSRLDIKNRGDYGYFNYGGKMGSGKSSLANELQIEF